MTPIFNLRLFTCFEWEINARCFAHMLLGESPNNYDCSSLLKALKWLYIFCQYLLFIFEWKVKSSTYLICILLVGYFSFFSWIYSKLVKIHSSLLSPSMWFYFEEKWLSSPIALKSHQKSVPVQLLWAITGWIYFSVLLKISL